MRTAGFVLAGGASSRMGTNKALLQLGDLTLIEMIAAAVREAVGTVTIVGRPGDFPQLDIPVIPDRRLRSGPLAGIEAALSHTTADWNLILACDMPNVTGDTLQRILREADRDPERECILPVNRGGRPEPLCALYHKRSLGAISAALDAGIRKVTDALPRESVRYVEMFDDPIFQNINTPEEWWELRQARQARTI